MKCKTILILAQLVILLAFFACNPNQNKVLPSKTDWKEYKLLGEVKDVVVYTKSLDPSAADDLKEYRKNSSFHFTETGMLKARYHYDIIGTVIKSFTCEHNGQNKIVSTEYRDVELLSSIDETYHYDSKERLIKIEQVHKGLSSGKTLNLYDTLGNLMEVFQQTQEASKLVQMNTNNYNIEGKLLESNSIFISEKDTLLASKKYSYLPNGKMSQEIVVSVMGKTITDYVYNEELLIEIRTTRNDVLARLSKYDQHENIVYVADYEPTGELMLEVTNEYTFDNLGNWIEKTVSQYTPTEGDEKARKVKQYKREITYY